MSGECHWVAYVVVRRIGMELSQLIYMKAITGELTRNEVMRAILATTSSPHVSYP